MPLRPENVHVIGFEKLGAKLSIIFPNIDNAVPFSSSVQRVESETL